MAEIYKNNGINIASSSPSAVYITPAATTSIVKTCIIANTTNVAVSVTVVWIDSSNASGSTTLLYGVSIPANASLNVCADPLILEAGDILKVTSGNSSGYLSVTVGVLEMS